MDYTAFLKVLMALPAAELVRRWPWAYPILETVHVIGLGLLFGGIFAFDLRLLGVQPTISIRRLARHLLPWVWLGFALNALSGLLLLMSDAVEFGHNTSFKVKMVLIAVAGLNMAWFHWRIFPTVAQWDERAPTPLAAKRTALVSIALWLSVITAGRMIAYIP